MKRIVCLLLALVLITGSLPLTTFAEGETCTCETACTAESRNAECPVCKDLDGEGVCPKTASVTPEPTCNCTSKCAAGAMSPTCPVCSVENVTPEVCTYSPPVTYTVTYKDAEDSNSFNPQTDVVNAGAATPAFVGTPTREGFLFDGWNPEVTETVTADVTYTAKWAEAVTITYKDGKNGEIFEEKTIKVKKGDPTPAYTLNSSYTSWTLKEWDPAVEETADADATYTAQWEKKGDNKLVLNANHSDITENATSESTSEASSIAIPATSWSVEQYELNGWNTQEDGKGTSYSQNATVNFDGPHNGQTITLYAQWVSVAGKPEVGEDINGLLEDYKVKIAVVGDDTFSIEKDAKDVAGAYALKGNDVVGYTLEVTLSLDTTTETACKTEINEHYTPTGETTKTDDWRCVEPKSQTVAFKWDAENGGWKAPEETEGMTLATFYMNQYFTVTYTDGVDGKTLFDDQTASVVKGADTPAFKGTPTRTGYAFAGWDGEVADKVTADVTYTAQWTANTYTVKFDPGADDATGTMADQTLTYDKAEKLTKNAFTRKGYKFMYWREKTEAGIYNDQDEVENLATGGEVTLVAQWKPSVERVDFSLSGHGYKKEITSAKVTPGTNNKGVSYGTGYGDYGDNYGITKNSPDTARLDSGTFADNTAYYLYVKFYVNQGYTCADLTKEDVFLNGVPAISLTGNGEDQPATQDLNDEVVPGTELTAVFKLKTIYLIKASAGKNGSISPKDTVAVFEGDDVTFTITPDKGYVRSTLKVDDKKVTTAKTYTFKDVDASHKIRATFAKDSGNAKTGDDLRILWALAAAVLSAAALTTALVIAKKKKK